MTRSRFEAEQLLHLLHHPPTNSTDVLHFEKLHHRDLSLELSEQQQKNASPLLLKAHKK